MDTTPSCHAAKKVCLRTSPDTPSGGSIVADWISTLFLSTYKPKMCRYVASLPI